MLLSKPLSMGFAIQEAWTTTGTLGLFPTFLYRSEARKERQCLQKGCEKPIYLWATWSSKEVSDSLWSCKIFSDKASRLKPVENSSCLVKSRFSFYNFHPNSSCFAPNEKLKMAESRDCRNKFGLVEWVPMDFGLWNCSGDPLCPEAQIFLEYGGLSLNQKCNLKWMLSPQDIATEQSVLMILLFWTLFCLHLTSFAANSI